RHLLRKRSRFENQVPPSLGHSCSFSGAVGYGEFNRQPRTEKTPTPAETIKAAARRGELEPYAASRLTAILKEARAAGAHPRGPLGAGELGLPAPRTTWPPESPADLDPQPPSGQAGVQPRQY